MPCSGACIPPEHFCGLVRGLPTEGEWELATRAGLDGAEYVEVTNPHGMLSWWRLAAPGRAVTGRYDGELAGEANRFDDVADESSDCGSVALPSGAAVRPGRYA
jgi:formylglycine-generating enzyme required for sulfatase activity